MDIVQYNARDVGGPATLALTLHRGFVRRGSRSRLYVGIRQTDENSYVYPPLGLPSLPVLLDHAVARSWPALPRFPGRERLRIGLSWLARPWLAAEWWCGIQDVHAPAGRGLRTLRRRPDVILLHNLHPGLFDLRILPDLAAIAPVVIALHDQWLMTGHCSHTRGCTNWRIGCGACPHLDTYPGIRRDGTVINAARKAAVYGRSRFHIVAPCRWILDQARQSTLWPSTIDARVIPSGVDLGLFAPGDRARARALLGLPQDAVIFLFAAFEAQTNSFKDYDLLVATFDRFAAPDGRPVVFLVLGDTASERRRGRVRLIHRPYTAAPQSVALHYQAADVYLHPARAETFPVTILEALASGLPVVATAVGGIPEQVLPFAALSTGAARSDTRPAPHEVTGVLLRKGDLVGLLRATEMLASNPELCRRLGENAAADARRRFDLEAQIDAYLAWFAEIVAVRSGNPTGDREGTSPCLVP